MRSRRACSEQPITSMFITLVVVQGQYQTCLVVDPAIQIIRGTRLLPGRMEQGVLYLETFLWLVAEHHVAIIKGGVSLLAGLIANGLGSGAIDDEVLESSTPREYPEQRVTQSIVWLGGPGEVGRLTPHHPTGL